MALRLLLLLCSAAVASAAQDAHMATPIEKVVVLLKKLSTQLEAEGKQEAADYDKYSCFCKEQADEKLYAIETSNKKIGVLKAKQDELKANINSLNGEIIDLGKKISGFE